MLLDKKNDIFPLFWVTGTLSKHKKLTTETQQTLASLLSDKNIDANARLSAARTLSDSKEFRDKAQQALKLLFSDSKRSIRYEAAKILVRQYDHEIGRIERRARDSIKPRTLPPRNGGAENDAIRIADEQPIDLREIFESALSASNDEKARHMRKLFTALQYKPESGALPNPTRELIDQLIRIMEKYPDSKILADDPEKRSAIRQALVDTFAGRLESLVNRQRKHGAATEEEEKALLNRLPAALIIPVLDRIVDNLSEAGKEASLSRLIDLAFTPDGPDTPKVAGLYAKLLKWSDRKSRNKIYKQMSLAILEDDPGVRGAASQCLAVYLSKLDDVKRRNAFNALVSSARDDVDASVRKTAAWSLQMIGRRLTGEEWEALEKNGLAKPGV